MFLCYTQQYKNSLVLFLTSADLHFADLKVKSESEVDELFVNEVNGLTFPADDAVIKLTGASYSTLHSVSFEHVEAKANILKALVGLAAFLSIHYYFFSKSQPFPCHFHL